MHTREAHPLPRVGLILLLLLAPAVASAQPAQVFPSAEVRPDKILLSESTRLTLALEGPAPLRVELRQEPEKLLAPESAAVWQIRRLGPAKRTALPDGRERWEESFRLDWWGVEGTATIAFAPVNVTAGGDVNAREITWPAQTVRVQATIPDPKAENARPVTGIEELPPVPSPPPEAVGWQFLAALGAVFAAALVVALVRRARAKPPPLPPGEWAVRELDRLDRDLEHERATGGEAAARIAAVLREFAERRYGLPAPKLTTSELLAECERATWPADQAAPLRELLERCDRAKFAGDVPDAAEAAELVNRARGWIGLGERGPSGPCSNNTTGA